jgi:hypothetical protein
MPNFYDNLANFSVYPTEGDHYGAGVVGDGRLIKELTITPFYAGLCPQRNVVLAGFALPSSGSAASGRVAAGTAVVSGYYVTGAGAYTIAAGYTNSATNWVWLVLIRSAGKVIRPEIQVETGTLKPTDPADSVLLGAVIVDGSGTITSAIDCRNSGRRVMGYLLAHRESGENATITTVDHASGGWYISNIALAVITITFTQAFVRTPLAVVLNVGATGSATLSATSITFTMSAADAGFLFEVVG